MIAKGFQMEKAARNLRPWEYGDFLSEHRRTGVDALDRLERIRSWVDREFAYNVKPEQWTALGLDLGEIRDALMLCHEAGYEMGFADARATPSEPPVAMEPHTDGVARINAERRRQVEREGWSAEHDDTHTVGELAICASEYALPAYRREYETRGGVRVPVLWPFACCDWKPGDRIRELEKAGALIAAEIDRLLRATPSESVVEPE